MVVRIHPGQFLSRPTPRLLVQISASLLLGLALLFPLPTQGRQLPPDSLELLSQARQAQRGFERIHRSLLPPTEGKESGGCDERAGTLCFRFAGDSDWEPLPEDPLVSAARTALLDSLETIGASIPGDRWVLGQRIRYLGDVGRWEEALGLARECSVGEDRWCRALQGYVLHRSGNAVEALQAFEEALRGMDPEDAARWRDPYPLVDAAAGRWLRSPAGLSPAEALSRFWRLADPLFLTPGNERLTEHYARRFAASLYQGSSLTLGVPWGNSLAQILLRYGFPAGWDRATGRIGEIEPGSVLEHFHPESRGLLPPLEALENPSGLPEGVWLPLMDRPRSASAPVMAPLIVEGVGQTAVLRRGGNLLVAAAYGVPPDTASLGLPPPVDPDWIGGEGEEDPPLRPLWEPTPLGLSSDTIAGLFLLEDESGWAPWASMGRGGEGVLQLQVPPGAYLLSLELWDPVGRWGSRIRHGIGAEAVPPDVPTLSELLLLHTGEDLPDSLPQGLQRMRASTTLSAGEPFALAWEVYGLGGRREPLTFRVSLLNEGGSLIRRALKRIGLFRRSPDLSLSWTEAGAETPGPLFRAVELELPPLDPGRYVLRLEMELPYRSKVVSIRRITVS
ncbi:hypothetical protein ACFL5A_00580 [Gemmatimonadota bacterium]